jgi:hypothetical protein
VVAEVITTPHSVAYGQEDRLQEALDQVPLGVAEELAGDPGEAAEDRQHAQHNQRHGHGPRRFVEVMLRLLAAPELTVEGHKDQAEHVESGQHCTHHAEYPECVVGRSEVVEIGGAGLECLEQNLVLGEEAGEDRDPGNRQGRSQEGPVGDRHVLLEPAHLADVLLTAAGVDHRSRTEEEAGLEERMGQDMEDGGHEGADTGAEEHIAELGHGGVSQHLLDVVLHQTDGGGKDRGQSANDRHHQHGGRAETEDDVAPHNHVDPCGDHGRGVDEGRHRCRAGHCVGQPDVERDLGRLADRADKEQQTDHGRGRRKVLGMGRRHREELGELKGAEDHEGGEDGEQEAPVADSVDDEGLHARSRTPVLLEIEADQQVGAETHTFPTDEEDRQVGAQHQHQHREHEEVEVGEVARVRPVRLVVHVTDRVDVDQEANEGDERHHQRRDRIELEGGRDVDFGEAAVEDAKRTTLDPAEEPYDMGVVDAEIEHPLNDRPPPQQPGKAGTEECDGVGDRFAETQPIGNEPVEDRPE